MPTKSAVVPIVAGAHKRKLWRALNAIDKVHVSGDDWVTVTRSKEHLGVVLTSDLSSGPEIKLRN